MSTPQGLTSTTAPGKMFTTRSDLAEHYKSDWHKYNLKRREANMAMLTHDEFSARLEAAMAMRREKEGREERSGRDHLKDKNADGKKSKKKSRQRLSKRQLRQQERCGTLSASIQNPAEAEDGVGDMEVDNNLHNLEEEEVPEINPRQSLFDTHVSAGVQENIEYMYKKYGFFVPDAECLVDKEGLIGYCSEKIKLGHICLYCQRLFKTWRGCQEHMINTRHTKLRYEAGIDLHEYDPFYDFTADNKDFMQFGIGNHRRKQRQNVATDDVETEEFDEEVLDDDDGKWEDIDSDEDMEEQDGIYAAYQDEINRHGFDVTPLGELVFPDGRIIGHRGLSKYYKQRIAPEDERVAVTAAKKSSGERVYQGRVYDTYAMKEQGNRGSKESALILAKSGLSMGEGKGRAGKGILVPSGGNARGTAFTALSLYRYKAVVKKAKREEFKGRRLQQRTTLPMNKMDKKANRLFNNVSVAHAKR
uniref:C2H2-type domain-containing protein n=1 Tax=Chaetoceros debilis TaxID=122233 RepID=A0A7S3PUX8_9STRA